MMARRRLLLNQRAETNVYIHNLKPAYIIINNRLIHTSQNASRIGFFGTAAQAGQYTTYSTNPDLRFPVIKLPKDTISITISFDAVTRLYNGSDVYIFWAKDTPVDDALYPSYAEGLSGIGYNVRENNAALKVNTLAVPNGADSFVGFFRVYPAIAETETPESIADNLGFVITFNK